MNNQKKIILNFCSNFMYLDFFGERESAAVDDRGWLKKRRRAIFLSNSGVCLSEVSVTEVC